MYSLTHEQILKSYQNQTITEEDFKIYERIITAKDSIEKSMQDTGLFSSGEITSAVRNQLPNFWFLKNHSSGRLNFRLVVNGAIPEPVQEKEIEKAINQVQLRSVSKMEEIDKRIKEGVDNIVAEANEIRKSKGESLIPIRKPVRFTGKAVVKKIEKSSTLKPPVKSNFDRVIKKAYEILDTTTHRRA